MEYMYYTERSVGRGKDRQHAEREESSSERPASAGVRVPAACCTWLHDVHRHTCKGQTQELSPARMQNMIRDDRPHAATHFSNIHHLAWLITNVLLCMCVNVAFPH